MTDAGHDVVPVSLTLNKQFCSQQEESGLHKDEISSDKTDNHPCQLILALTYFNKIIAEL
jgi:hypothetical protein